MLRALATPTPACARTFTRSTAAFGLKDTPVSSLMGDEVHTIDLEATVAKATLRMNEKKIGSLAVTKDGTFVGLITTADYLKMGWASKDAGLDSLKLKVKDVGTVFPANLITCAPSTSVFDALQLVLGANIRHLPVVEDDVPVGMLSIKDLAEAAMREVDP